MSVHGGPADWWTQGTDSGRKHVATKGIVQNGLVLNLDAGVSESYPGTGTTWTDLSGNGNNGTLTNGPTYSSANGGSLVFDGSNDYVEITNNSTYQFTNTQPFTINSWVKWNNTTGGHIIFAYALTVGRGYYFSLFNGVNISGVTTNSFNFDYWDGSAFRGILGVNNSIMPNVWIMLTATSATNSVNDMKVYLNGVLVSYSNRGTGSPTSINYSTLPLRIGARGDGSYFNGDIPQVSIYNRALTAQEIQQNFNATRGRYGI